jgi:hypothetical protein
VMPTPVPTLPPMAMDTIRQKISAEVGVAVAMGLYPQQSDVQARMEVAQRQISNLIQEKAKLDAVDTERRMEDVLEEGGFRRAFELTLDDVVTFPAGIMAGPMVRERTVLEWAPNGSVKPVKALVEEFERVSPFDFYPDPNASDVDDGYMIRVHRMTPTQVSALRGSPGYSVDAIDKVMAEYGKGGLRDWLVVDQTGETGQTVRSEADYTHTIDAIEYWGDVPGKLLQDWGVPGVTDPAQVYQATVWLIADDVIMAVLNSDPLGKKPFGKACYEEIPGSFWGNGVPDLIRDVQTVCNAAARAMVNNMGIASGPQVWYATDRLPPGVTVTELFPWKIWPMNSDLMGTSAPPMDFFQPSMHAVELMQVFEKYSDLADEYSGIPKYMAGDQNAGGAAKTASGLSMLMANANKLMKHVVGNIDRLMESVLQRLHLYLIYVKQDPLVRGDVRLLARGALAVIVKDTMQLRRQELLTQTANPIDIQVIGLDGRANLWRENLKGLGINPDGIIPPSEVVAERQARMEQQQAAMAAKEAMPTGQGGQQQLAAPSAPQTDPMQSGMTGGYPGDMNL